MFFTIRGVRMNILLLGNGFDLYHKLPTRYDNFLHTVNFLINSYTKEMTTIADIFGQEIFSIHRRRDYASFQEYTRRNERKYGAKDNTINTKQQNGTRSHTKGNTSSKSDSIENAYFVPNINVNSNNKFSIDLDRSYLESVERGDMETAQRLVDEAAKNAGYTVKGYHGTGADFNIFSEENIGKRNVWGKGFYFGTSKGIAAESPSK